MRELLRTPGKAFDRVGEGETCVVTRNGRPVAALVPITEENAEAALLAASPRLEQDRRDAEHAREEGRTMPLEEVAKRFGVEAPAADLGDLEKTHPWVLSYVTRSSEGKGADATALEQEIDGHLIKGFACAAAGSDPTTGEASERAFGWAARQVVELKEEAGRIPSELGSDQSSVSKAYVLGGVDAIDRVVRQTRSAAAGRKVRLRGLSKRRLRLPSGD
jgi:antitoxin (DNA-binding transcriptional repressor) of toxin-antitoxin stability system